jgi:acyl-CoA synthetase (NDP forming)/RimJ/RimL family protein N-acetyltransferase
VDDDVTTPAGAAGAAGAGPEVPEDYPVPGEYPAGWEADVVLSDGGTVHVRPIRPDDHHRLLDFHSRQSPESIYFRYFTPRPRLSEREVEHLTTVDYVDRMAFVALRDDELVGVARYDRWPTRSEAEVAFFVDDRHTGRGMATLLLEYLAAAARRAGLSSFTATVLPTNHRMVGVFRSAGFEARSAFDDGLIEVRLDLKPTPAAEAAIEARAQRAEAEAVRLLLAPRSVAVIGAGRDRASVGHAVLRNLLHHEFTGPVYPVNRAAEHVGGVPAYPSLEAIEGPVDLAVVVVPAAEVAGVVEQCGHKGVKAVIVISAGFSEAGPEGIAHTEATLRAARRFGIRLLGPNCLGVINTDPDVRLHATFATPHAHRGKVALLSESGTIGGVILERMGAAGLGASSFAAIGNRADVSANDLLQWWDDDPRTELVLLYLESFGNARKFSRIARELGRRKPIVAVKSGGAARAYPTTGADVPSATVDALLRQTGVIRVDTLTQLLDVARALTCQPLPAGNRVALVGNGGGSLALAADACVDAGLELASLSDLHGAVGPAARIRSGTVDLGFEADSGDLDRALRAVLADEGVDSVLVVGAPAPRQPAADLLRAVDAAARDAKDTVLVGCVFGDHPGTVGGDDGRSVPLFDFPDEAAYALGRVTQYAAWRARAEGAVVVPAGARPHQARTLLVEALAAADTAGSPAPAEGGTTASPAPQAPATPMETAPAPVAPVPGSVAGAAGEPALPVVLPTSVTLDVLAAAGLAPVPSHLAADAVAAAVAAAGWGYPVAAKAFHRSRLAKTEAGGVALDIHDEVELRAALDRMEAALGDAAWPMVVQPMVGAGVDVAVTVAEHPLVGPVLTVGPGGVATAVADVQVQVLPLTDRDAEALVAESSMASLLDDASRAHLADLLLRVGALVEEAPEVVGLELNPIILSPAGAAIADARLRAAPVPQNPLPPVRRV